MQIEVKSLPQSEILIIVEVPEDLFTSFEEQASRKISESLDIPGFRRGQAPKAFVISHVGPDAFFQEVLSIALPQSYLKAIQEKKLNPISRPEIKVTSKSPLKYEARVGLMPEVKLKGYEKIKLPASEIAVTEEELEEVIMEMRKYRATYKPLERDIRKGDRVEIDFQGYDEKNAPVDKTKSSSHPLFVGEGSLVSGFEEQLVGMKIREKKKFPVTFPKDFRYESLKGKTVYFETEVKRAEEPILPELDETFVAAIMGEKKTVPEFKEALKVDLHRRKTLDDRRKRENALLEKFLKDAVLEVPPVLVEEEIDYMIEDLKRDVEARGLVWETYVEQLTKQSRDLRKEFLPDAEKRIRIRLILNYLFRAMEISVNDEEMEIAGKRLIESSPEANRKAISDNLVSKGNMYQRLKNNLMLEKLFGRFLD